MATAKTTTMRLTSDDLAILDEARRRTGVISRSEALRVVLKRYADAEGIELSKPKPRKRTK